MIVKYWNIVKYFKKLAFVKRREKFLRIINTDKQGFYQKDEVKHDLL